MGLYYAPQRLIFIDPRLSCTQLRCTLTHELVHATYNDSSCTPYTTSKNERRTRKETARSLFSDAEYKTAELLYDGNIYDMAAELDVTPQVVADYQQLVLPTLLLPEADNTTICS